MDYYLEWSPLLNLLISETETLLRYVLAYFTTMLLTIYLIKKFVGINKFFGGILKYLGNFDAEQVTSLSPTHLEEKKNK